MIGTATATYTVADQRGDTQLNLDPLDPWGTGHCFISVTKINSDPTQGLVLWVGLGQICITIMLIVVGC